MVSSSEEEYDDDDDDDDDDEEEESDVEDSDCDEASESESESDDNDVDDSSLSDKVASLLRGFNFTNCNEVINGVFDQYHWILRFMFDFARRKGYWIFETKGMQSVSTESWPENLGKPRCLCCQDKGTLEVSVSNSRSLFDYWVRSNFKTQEVLYEITKPNNHLWLSLFSHYSEKEKISCQWVLLEFVAAEEIIFVLHSSKKKLCHIHLRVIQWFFLSGEDKVF